MTSRERDSIQYRLKQFFRMNRSGSVSSSRNDLPISPELERELRPETPVTQRCKALKDFGEQVMSSRLEPDAVQSLYDLTKDLLVGNKLMEQRQCALAFYCKLIQGQYDSLGLMRAQFYRVIVSHSEPEDIGYRLEMLKQLTETGKNIQHFEKEIGPFLLEWIKPIHEAGLIDPLLELIVNLIKYNAASLEPKFLVGVVSYIFDMTCNKQETPTVLLCLSVLDCFICYAIIPNESLTLFIIILCRMVNQEAYCQHSWKIMKNLFGTALGHATLLTMCNILNNSVFHQDDALLRGAIFHTNVGLWGVGGCVVPILNCSPSLVLTSFWNALKSRHVVVTYEVILSMNRLIQKSGTELNEPTWDNICDIMTEISHNLAIHRLPAEHIVLTHFHDTLNIMEGILQQGAMNADPEKIYGLIEKVSAERPEASVRRLIDYRASKISATQSEWLRQLCQFMDRFYRMKNSGVRIYAVQALERIMAANRAAYEDEILERIVIVHLGSVPLEKDAEVRKAVARTLIEFTIHCETKRCIELLEIVEKLLHRPYEELHDVRTEHEVEDVILLVDGLIRLFTVKLYRLPSLHAIRVYSMLIGLLELHYQRPHVLANVSTIRYRIFGWMMKARANGSFHIGYPDPEDGNRVRFSHYLGLEGPYQHQSLQPQPYLSSQSSSQLNLSEQPGGAERSSLDRIPATNLTTISIKRGCQVIVLCLKEEKDWEVIQLVLTELPNVMQNKALIQGNDVDSLARTLYRMYTDRMQLEKLQVPANMLPKVSDYMELILPALSSLAMYHQHLDFNTQKNIIEALKVGLISRRPQDCIRTLTILLLEMPDQLMPKMADLLLEQSKMTSTKTVALPVLEFLSTLILVPSFRFGNFNTRTYMCVMAMSLPYTNPFRYDHYTVSLAHYVVAAWFIKCKLPMRHQLVKFIVQGLESYVKVPFQDGSRTFSQANEDSSERKRSSSLTEQGSRRRDRIQAQQQQQQQAQQPTQKSQQQQLPNSSSSGTSNQQQQQHQQQQQQQGAQQGSKGPVGPLSGAGSGSGSSSAPRVYPVSGLNDDMFKFHCELAETCVDFMVRHTFSPCSGISKRLPSAEFLLSGGQSMTWLVGHDLITITTSGCSGINFRNGMCDRCHQYCAAAGNDASKMPSQQQQQQPYHHPHHHHQQHHHQPQPPTAPSSASSLHQPHPMLSKSNSSASTTTTTTTTTTVGGGQPLSPEPPSSAGSSGKDSGLSGIGGGNAHATSTMTTDHSAGKLAADNGGSVAAAGGQLSATSNKRYTKASLQHSSANESDSTDLTTSSSTSSSTAATPFPHSAHGPMSGGGGSASAVGSTAANRFFRQGSQEGYSSGSLEALSRRGSNPDSVDHGGPGAGAATIGSGVGELQQLQRTSSLVAPRGPPGMMATIGNRLILPQQLGGSMTGGSSASSGIGFDRPVQPCACLCNGWAEVSVRRPTGYTSWIIRIQSQVSHDILGGDVALQDLTCLFSPSVGGGVIGTEFPFYSGGPHGAAGGGGSDSLTPFGSSVDIPATMTDRFVLPGGPDVASNAGSVELINAPQGVISPPGASNAAASSRAKVSISDEVFELAKKADDPKKKPSVEEENEQSEDEELKNVLLAGGAGESVSSLSGGGSGPINIPGKHAAVASDEEDGGDGDDDDDDDDDDADEDEDDDDEDDSDEGRGRGPGRGRYEGGHGHDGVVFDDAEGRSVRKPVRRVNSSPEMGSKWNSKFLGKATKAAAATAVDVTGAPMAGAGPDGGTGMVEPVGNSNVGGPVPSDGAVVEKKKSSTYGKGVSCEAIPEEIAGSTPPPPSTLLRTQGPPPPTIDPIAPTVRGTMAAKHQAEFSTAKSAITTSLPETNTLVEPVGAGAAGPGVLAPRKQHSADDAIAPSRSLAMDGVGASTETINVPPGNTNAPAVVNTIAPIALHPITQTSSASALSLKLPMEKVTSKPPQSPVPLSPRLLARNTANLKQSNSGTASPSFPSMMAGVGGGGVGVGMGGIGGGGGGGNDNDVPRGRSKTISTVREHYARDGTKWSASNVARIRNEHLSRTVVSPSFVFLQLYHHGQFGPERPVLMDRDPEKAIALLDLIPPFEMHKIGVLYVGPGQAGNETEILKNRYGSLRYSEFLSSLGTLVAIKDAKEKNIFIDLESNGKDGAFTYIYQDDIVQITFHVATLMPNKKQDPHCNEKKKHIGNDFVTIVYNESGEQYDLKTIKGQYNYACVVVEPIELNSNRVFVRSKDDISQHVTRETKIVSDHSAPLLARQMALHANLASLVAQSLKTKNSSPYASNWLERLRKIKNIRSRYGQQLLEQEQQRQLQQQQQMQQGGSANDLSSTASTLGGGITYRVDDFSKYTV